MPAELELLFQKIQGAVPRRFQTVRALYLALLARLEATRYVVLHCGRS